MYVHIPTAVVVRISLLLSPGKEMGRVDTPPGPREGGGGGGAWQGKNLQTDVYCFSHRSSRGSWTLTRQHLTLQTPQDNISQVVC